MKLTKIRKRDGRIADFDKSRITEAIFKAARAVGGQDKEMAQKLSDKVMRAVEKNGNPLPNVEDIQDIVEKILIDEGHAKTAKAYILYRQKRAEMRAAAEEAAKTMDEEKIALADMFAHKSKLASLIGYDRIEAYKNLLFYLMDRIKSGKLPVSSDYLGGAELPTNIYQKKYFLKDLKNRRIEKRPEDVFCRMAAFMAAVEPDSERQVQWAEKYYNALYEGWFLPGGRVIAGAGDLYRLKTMANCFVSLIEEDNIESIYKTAYECARTYSYGGGIGVDISVLRPRDSVVHNAADNSTGSVSFMEIYSLTTGLIGQSARRGALMITIDVKHPDSPLFVNVKKIPNWVTQQIVEQCKWSGMFNEQQLREIARQVRENTQVRFANISLKVSDEFMKAVEEQTTYGPKKILVYRKNKEISGLGAVQAGKLHYSYNIPSKPIDKYELHETFGSLEDLNDFLATRDLSPVTEEEFNDARGRDMFGDFIIPYDDETDLAVKYAGDFMLYFNCRETGEIKRMIKARDLWNSFVEGNYRTAEPGLIFWSTMTKYSPSNYVGRPIASTNPCVAADSLISTENGLERVDSVKAQKITIDTRVSANGLMHFGTQLITPAGIFPTGFKDCYRVETISGYEIIATPDHRILTTDGWKEVSEITENDSILIQSGKGSFRKDPKLPFSVNNEIMGRNGRTYKLNLPSEWSRELGMLLGWAVGDGFFNESYNKFGLVFAQEDRDARKIIQPVLEKYCNRQIKEIKYPNGCVQLRSSSKYFIDFIKKLGMKQAYEEREVPAALFTAPEEAVLGFLEGLFSSDGTIGLGSKSRNYIRLNSSSLKLLKQVQVLLLNLGIRSRIYDRSTKFKTFRYTNKKGEIVKYKTSGTNYELNISKENVVRFVQAIKFFQEKNQEKTAALKKFDFYEERFTDKVRLKEYAGKREVWDITEGETHSFIANGIIVHNCGEVPLEDGGACNLGSINLSRFVTDGYTDRAKIDWIALKEAAAILTRFLDAVVIWNEILNPLEKQRRAAAETRRLGIGVMGIADMFNQLGIEYDSESALELSEKAGRIIANASYIASAELAEEKGPSPIFSYENYSRGPFFREALDHETRNLIRRKGLRNIAVLSIAPTGTISSVVLGYRNGGKNYIGVSGGVEPIFALYYTRRSESFGNQMFKVFHSTVAAYIDKYGLMERAQESNEEELRKILAKHFFRTAHYVEPEQRVRIQGVWQKYIDHSISSTVNLPEDIDPETISNIYRDAWNHGLKGITVYRAGSRYPILSTEETKNEFQKYKDKTFEVHINGSTSMMQGDDFLTLPNGALTTVYHAIKNGTLRIESEAQETVKLVAHKW